MRKIAKTEVDDVLHYTLIINDSPAGAYVAGARKVYPELSRHGVRVEHVYNFWPRGDSFAGITSTLKTRDGLIWKLSIHTPRSYRAVNETRSQIEQMRHPDTKPEERASLFQALVDVWDIVPVPKGALAQGAIYPRDRLVVLDEFDQIGSADREAKLDAWAMRWRHGLWFESVNGEHRFHIGGRMLLDVGVVHQSSGLRHASYSGTASGVKFRQARILAEGKLYRHLAFKINYDFADGDANFADVWGAVEDIGPIDAITIGHFKVPFSFEQAMSRMYLTFMERSLANALAPNIRETGAGVVGRLLTGRLRWHVGGFSATDSAGNGFGKDNGWDIAFRLTGLPIRADGDRKLLHLGFSYAHSFRDGSGLSFSSRPESYLADKLLQTSPSILATDIDVVNGELALVLGSFTLEAEYLHNFVRRSNGPTLNYHGGYVQASYYLTGESRRYTLGLGTFDRIVPNRNIKLGTGGWGAWQVAARFSRLDLDDQDVGGGTEANFTAAVNWYPTAITRFSTEYVFGSLWGQGHVHVWQMRFQFNF